MKKSAFLFLLIIVLSAQLRGQESQITLNYETALKIQEGSLEYARENNLKLAIAIYDVHANLISFIRMDGASVGVSKIARWKGLSAASYLYPTSATSKWNIETAPNISTAEGGIPIFSKEGEPLGGIGVSGALSAIDVKCAEAGLNAVGLYKEVTED